MQPLRSVLMALAERPGVAGVVVVSDDGLAVEASVPPERDADEISALATTVARGLESLGGAAGLGTVDQTVVDGPDGSVILQRLPSGALLIVLVSPQGDLGELLHDVRRHAPALVSLL